MTLNAPKCRFQKVEKFQTSAAPKSGYFASYEENVFPAAREAILKGGKFYDMFTAGDIYTEDKTNLYLGDGETLYYPWSYSLKQFIVNSCRGYFRLNNGLTAGELPSVQAPLRIEMNIGAQHTTTNLGGDNTPLSQPSSVHRKVLSNGQLFILLPDGTRYDATGKKVG